jgi:hypothetical protein
MLVVRVTVGVDGYVRRAVRGLGKDAAIRCRHLGVVIADGPLNVSRGVELRQEVVVRAIIIAAPIQPLHRHRLLWRSDTYF